MGLFPMCLRSYTHIYTTLTHTPHVKREKEKKEKKERRRKKNRKKRRRDTLQSSNPRQEKPSLKLEEAWERVIWVF